MDKLKIYWKLLFYLFIEAKNIGIMTLILLIVAESASSKLHVAFSLVY